MSVALTQQQTMQKHGLPGELALSAVTEAALLHHCLPLTAWPNPAHDTALFLCCYFSFSLFVLTFSSSRF